MKEIASLSTVYLLFLFVIPGFVAFQALKIICPPIGRKGLDFYLSFITLSGLNFALFGTIIGIIDNDEVNIFVRIVLWSLYIFFFPVVEGIVIGGMIQNNVLQRILRSHALRWTRIRPSSFGVSAWDSLFSNIEARYAVVTLLDGTEFKAAIAAGAHMSADAAERDIYFDRLYESHGDEPWRQVPKSLYVAKDQIRTIEFFDPA